MYRIPLSVYLHINIADKGAVRLAWIAMKSPPVIVKRLKTSLMPHNEHSDYLLEGMVFFHGFIVNHD